VSIRTWRSRWYSEKDYASQLQEDLRIRGFVKTRLNHAGVSSVEIERRSNRVTVLIATARPGIVIGKKGAEIENLKKEIQKLTPKEVSINIVEIRRPETDGQLTAENVAMQLERRVAFRRAMKKTVLSSMKLGAKDAILAVLAPGLLANDADAEGGLLTVALVAGPAHGILTLGEGGAFSYTPAADF